VRAGALHVQHRAGDLAVPGQVELAEISGSDTFVHDHTQIGEMVAQPTDLAHACRRNPQRDEDYALLPLKRCFDDGGACALLGLRAAARRPCATSSLAW
jgi:hypothetical protein